MQNVYIQNDDDDDELMFKKKEKVINGILTGILIVLKRISI